jgi:5-methylcytosine-specific restriction endonuclease McrA
MTTEEPDSSNKLLDSQVLVINKHFKALRVISVRRAFTLLCKNAAEIIAKSNGHYDTYELIRWIKNHGNGHKTTADEYIHTPAIKIKIPRVIRLIAYDKYRCAALRLTKKNILIRDNNCCQYCGKKMPVNQLSIDHIKPRSRGGAMSWENVVTSCHRCNTKKGGHLPHEVGMKLISQPIVPTQRLNLSAHSQDERYTLWHDFLKAMN